MDDLRFILHAIRENEKTVQETPKTFSIMESLYLEPIKRDFPELNVELAKTYANEIVTDYLVCLETGETKELEKDCTDNVITQAKSRYTGKIYRDVKFHRTAVNGYSRNRKEAKIVFQSSCQYTTGGKMVQTRFETVYVYFLEETEHNHSALLRCSYCGAPMQGVGEKVCRYCEHGIVDTIKKTWKFCNIREF